MISIVMPASIAAAALASGVAVLGLRRRRGDPRIADIDEALAIAADADAAFEPVEAVVDRAGFGALVRGADGRHMLIRRRGNRFEGRVLRTPYFARLDRRFLTLGATRRISSRVILDLGDAAPVWARRLEGVVHRRRR